MRCAAQDLIFVQSTLVQVMVRCLIHWGRVTHICVSKLTIIGSDNGLSPGQRQAIIWVNAGVLLIGPLGTNFSEISIEIYTFSFKKMHFKMSSWKWRPFCLCLNVLIAPNHYLDRCKYIDQYHRHMVIAWPVSTSQDQRNWFHHDVNVM